MNYTKTFTFHFNNNLDVTYSVVDFSEQSVTINLTSQQLLTAPYTMYFVPYSNYVKLKKQKS